MDYSMNKYNFVPYCMVLACIVCIGLVFMLTNLAPGKYYQVQEYNNLPSVIAKDEAKPEAIQHYEQARDQSVKDTEDVNKIVAAKEESNETLDNSTLNVCGDNVCGKREDGILCPKDCKNVLLFSTFEKCEVGEGNIACFVRFLLSWWGMFWMITNYFMYVSFFREFMRFTKNKMLDACIFAVTATYVICMITVGM